jgi:hypothetical protein
MRIAGAVSKNNLDNKVLSMFMETRMQSVWNGYAPFGQSGRVALVVLVVISDALISRGRE